MSDEPKLPELTKRYYTIGEVAELMGINASNLRYWEREFPQLAPKKTEGGKRRYTAENIRLIASIHHLVKERGFTLEGAKKHLNKQPKQVQEHAEVVQKLKYVKGELQKILRIMKAQSNSK